MRRRRLSRRRSRSRGGGRYPAPPKSRSATVFGSPLLVVVDSTTTLVVVARDIGQGSAEDPSVVVLLIVDGTKEGSLSSCCPMDIVLVLFVNFLLTAYYVPPVYDNDNMDKTLGIHFFCFLVHNSDLLYSFFVFSSFLSLYAVAPISKQTFSSLPR